MLGFPLEATVLATTLVEEKSARKGRFSGTVGGSFSRR
jgi:hypothetical protein